jgi:biopolymer transport protein ExbD
MKRYSQRQQGHVLSELNVTPLLDLAFVLLIIFMITTPLIDNRIDVNLPSQDGTPAPPPKPTLIREITIDQNGAIFYSGTRVNLQELEIGLAKLKETDPDAAVSLRADRNLRYQNLVDALGVIRDSGVKLGLATQSSPK